VLVLELRSRKIASGLYQPVQQALPWVPIRCVRRIWLVWLYASTEAACGHCWRRVADVNLVELFGMYPFAPVSPPFAASSAWCILRFGASKVCFRARGVRDRRTIMFNHRLWNQARVTTTLQSTVTYNPPSPSTSSSESSSTSSVRSPLFACVVGTADPRATLIFPNRPG
jgi:hypothetical protein